MISVVIFGTSSLLIFDVNLIVQVVLLILLIIGRLSKANRKRHGIIMTIGTLSNLVTILLIMGPSLREKLPALLASMTLGTFITFAHAILGLVAILGGLLFTLRFVLALSAKKPLACGNRWMMRTEILLWIVSLVLGIGFYGFYYMLPH